MSSRTVFLEQDNARERFAHAWKIACELLKLGGQVRVRIDESKPTRTLEQNDKMWAVLTDISRQVQWPVDGSLQYIEPEDWKDILSAGLRKTQRVAQGIDGGFVMLGLRTSRMNVKEMMDLIDLAQAFGVEHNVRWCDD